MSSQTTLSRKTVDALGDGGQPVLQADFQAVLAASYVVPTRFGPTASFWSDDKLTPSQRLDQTMAELKSRGASHGDFQLLGDTSGSTSLLGDLLSVDAFALDRQRRFALVAGRVTQTALGVDPKFDVENSYLLSEPADGVVRTFHNSLWLWDGATGGLVPLQGFGSVSAIDIAPSGDWAVVIEHIHRPDRNLLSRVELPGGRRSWSVKMPSVMPHVRISPDEKWIATEGPHLVEVDERSVWAPSWVLDTTTVDATRAWPVWHPTQPGVMIALTMPSSDSDDVEILTIETDSGAILERRPVTGSDTRHIAQPRVSGLDIDPTGTYLLTVSEMCVSTDELPDSAPGALTCITIADSSVQWSQTVVSGGHAKAHRHPRFLTERAVGPAASVDCNRWTQVPATVHTDLIAGPLQARTAVDRTQFEGCARRLLDATLSSGSAEEVQRHGLLALREVVMFRRFEPADGLLAEFDRMLPEALDLARPDQPELAVALEQFRRRLKQAVDQDLDETDLAAFAFVSGPEPLSEPAEQAATVPAALRKGRAKAGEVTRRAREAQRRVETRVGSARAVVDRAEQSATQARQRATDTGHEVINALETALGKITIVRNGFGGLTIATAALAVIPVVVLLVIVGLLWGVAGMLVAAVAIGAPLLVTRRMSKAAASAPAIADELRVLLSRTEMSTEEFLASLKNLPRRPSLLSGKRILMVAKTGKGLVSDHTPALAKLVTTAQAIAPAALWATAIAFGGLTLLWLLMFAGLVTG